MSRMSRHDEKCHNFVRGTLYMVNTNEDKGAKREATFRMIQRKRYGNETKDICSSVNAGTRYDMRRM